MLNSRELARRLRMAMDAHDPRISSTAVAEACNVTPQAVNGWRKTGRIHKKHLAPLAELTGKTIEYFVSVDQNSGGDNLSKEAIALARDWMKLPEHYRNLVRESLEHATHTLEKYPELRRQVSDARVSETIKPPRGKAHQ